MSLLTRVKKKVFRYFKLDIKVKVHKLNALEKLGSEYGNWIIPQNYLTADAVCYLAGAGEDISFDVAIADKYKCEVFVIDPTPKAKAHYASLVEKTKNNEQMQVNNRPDQLYKLAKSTLKHIHYLDIGVWDKEEEIKFYVPKDKDHVSHSIVNLQKTEEYFTATVKPLKNIMQSFGHQRIDLLKLDIEGAEYNVIKSIIQDKIDVGVICMEFDEVYNHLDDQYWQRIQDTVDSLVNIGYVVVNIDEHYNTTFVKKEIYDRLK